MAERKAKTMDLQGNDYAKVAERLRLFREDHPRAKTESAYEYEVDKTLVFTVWIWKDKADLMELMKNGVTDKDILRSSADANGTAKSKGEIGGKDKDFEKLETVALGRALGLLGYLASGEIASSEEMEAFEEFRAQQHEKQVQETLGQIEATQNNAELNKVLQANSATLKFPLVIAAAKDKQADFAQVKEREISNKNPAPQPTQVNPKAHGTTVNPAKPEKPRTAPTLPLDEESGDAHS